MSSPVLTPLNPFRDPIMADGSHSSDATPSYTQPDAAHAGRKKRVGFSEGPDSTERSPRVSRIDGALGSPTTSPPGSTTPTLLLSSPDTTPGNDAQQSSSFSDGPPFVPRNSSIPDISAEQKQEIHRAFSPHLAVSRPRPAIRQQSTKPYEPPQSVDSEESDNNEHKAVRRARAREALERGQRLAEDERIRSEPNSRHASPERLPGRQNRPSHIRLDDIPLQDFGPHVRPAAVEDESESDDGGLEMPRFRRNGTATHAEAHRLVRKHTVHHSVFHEDASLHSGYRSGVATPTEETHYIEDYRPHPEQYRGGILSSLLKLYGSSQHGSSQGRAGLPKLAHFRSGSSSGLHSGSSTPQHSPPSSGATTPLNYFSFGHKHKSQSSSSLAQLVGSSTSLSSPSVPMGLGEQVLQRLKETEGEKKSGKRGVLNRLNRLRPEDEHRITVHIAETISRQRYLTRLCHALMMYGAPTHRLEEYLNMSARTLEVRAQFLYIPGSMIMSFDDASTHTTEVKLVRVEQGLDLGKLRDVHEIYKDVVHDRIGVDEAMRRLKEISNRSDKFSKWMRIPVYGLAAASVGPFAFGARWIDLPIAWVLGCVLGILQLFVAPRSQLLSNVFEIAATIITSFLARAFGSIRGGDLFCFSALAQSSIALILPGYTVLCASLELQSKSLVAGSVRMVYAVIYSLFLGYGIMIGSAIYGIMDGAATSRVECQKPMEAPLYFLFVPVFTMCLIIINQAKWKQAPMMLFIACVGYIVNFYSSKRFAGNAQVSNSLGALAVGVTANLYSRIGSRVENRLLDLWEDCLRPRWRVFRKRWVPRHESDARAKKSMEEGLSNDNESVYVRQKRQVGFGLAAAAMLPAIFVQVPSGLAVQGSLIQGITSANEIARNSTNGTTVASSATLVSDPSMPLNSTAFVTAYSVIQIAIGITVGLSLSAVVVYPGGKKRSGLFSF